MLNNLANITKYIIKTTKEYKLFFLFTLIYFSGLLLLFFSAKKISPGTWILLILILIVLIFLLYFVMPIVFTNKYANSILNDEEYKKILLKSGIKNIDQMDGRRFEKYLFSLFDKKGYEVKNTPFSSDYGVDVIARNKNESIAIQAKCYKNKVSINAIQEVVSGKIYYECNKAIVITNSYFTKNAKKLAKINNVELWNRDKLIEEIVTLKNIKLRGQI